jgi:hypothetical protein
MRSSRENCSISRNPFFKLIFTAIFILLVLSGCTEKESADITLSFRILSEDLEVHTETLASDGFNGRRVGTKGIERAEEYLARRFEEAGLSPVPKEDDYFLEFPLYEYGFDKKKTSIRVFSTDGNELIVHSNLNGNFKPFYFSGSGSIESEVIFAGYGITAPEYEYDDYAGLDVEGKIVFILRHEPNENDPTSKFAGREMTRHAYFTRKAENAYTHGAKGMILVTDPLHHDQTADLPLIMGNLSLSADENLYSGAERADVPDTFLALYTGQSFISTIMDNYSIDLAEVQRKLDSGISPQVIDMPRFRAAIEVSKQDSPRETAARNSAAIVAGSDNPDKWVVIGAHHDHLGGYEGEGDTIYNGADDNASGVAAVLELAHYFARNPPSVSVLFITFSAEEQGLLGSRAVFEHDLLPEEPISLMINIDMIGRNPDQPVTVTVHGVSEELRSAITEAAEKQHIDLDFRSTGRRYLSDHSSFQEQGIPVISFFTGLHDDYHKPSDEADKLIYDRMERIVKTVQLIIQHIE